jgi:hypothetical protein
MLLIPAGHQDQVLFGYFRHGLCRRVGEGGQAGLGLMTPGEEGIHEAHEEHEENQKCCVGFLPIPHMNGLINCEQAALCSGAQKGE